MGRLPSAALMREVHGRIGTEECGRGRPRHTKHQVHCEEQSDKARSGLVGRLPSAALTQWSPRMDRYRGTQARAPAPHKTPSSLRGAKRSKPACFCRHRRVVVPPPAGLLAMTQRSTVTARPRRGRSSPVEPRDHHGLLAALGGLAMTPTTPRLKERRYHTHKRRAVARVTRRQLACCR